MSNAVPNSDMGMSWALRGLSPVHLDREYLATGAADIKHDYARGALVINPFIDAVHHAIEVVTFRGMTPL